MTAADRPLYRSGRAPAPAAAPLRVADDAAITPLVCGAGVLSVVSTLDATGAAGVLRVVVVALDATGAAGVLSVVVVAEWAGAVDPMTSVAPWAAAAGAAVASAMAFGSALGQRELHRGYKESPVLHGPRCSSTVLLRPGAVGGSNSHVRGGGLPSRALIAHADRV
jgi:hypothetical protein